MHNEKLNNMLNQFTQSCNTFGQEAANFLKSTSSALATSAEQKWNGLKVFWQERVQKNVSPASEVTPSGDGQSSSPN
jgi:hypothetical protein